MSLIGTALLSQGIGMATSLITDKIRQDEEIKLKRKSMLNQAKQLRVSRLTEDENRFTDYNYQGNDINSLGFQAGGELSSNLKKLEGSELNQRYKLEESVDWFKDWVSNPEYSKRLSANLKNKNENKSFFDLTRIVPFKLNPFVYGDSYYKEEANHITNKALDRVNNTKIFYNDNFNKNKELSQEYANILFDKDKDPKYNEYTYLSNIVGAKGTYRPYTNSVFINGRYPKSSKSTTVHELTHSSSLDKTNKQFIGLPKSIQDEIDRLETENPGFKVKKGLDGLYLYKPKSKNSPSSTIKGKDFDKLLSFPKSEIEYLFYNSSEVYPRIMQIRYENDIKPGELIDKEKIKSIKNNFKDNLLFDYYDDEELINLLNTLSDDNSKNKEEVLMASNLKNKTSKQLAQGGSLVNINDTDSITTNEQGTFEGQHESGHNIFFKNTQGQSINLEPGEVVKDGNYALSKRNPSPNNSFANQYLSYKAKETDYKLQSSLVADPIESNRLMRLSKGMNYKAEQIPIKQERFNAVNEQSGFAGIPTNQMQAGGFFDEINKNADKLYRKEIKKADKLYKTEIKNLDKDFKNDLLLSSIDNIGNLALSAIDSFRKPTTLPTVNLIQTPSRRRYNPYSQIGNIDRDITAAKNEVDLSTSNSQVARAAKKDLTLGGTQAKQSLVSEYNKLNIGEDNRYNEQLLNINKENAAKLDRLDELRYSKDEQRIMSNLSNLSANISNFGDDINNLVNNERKANLDKEIAKIQATGFDEDTISAQAYSQAKTREEYKQIMIDNGIDEVIAESHAVVYWDKKR